MCRTMNCSECTLTDAPEQTKNAMVKADAEPSMIRADAEAPHLDRGYVYDVAFAPLEHMFHCLQHSCSDKLQPCSALDSFAHILCELPLYDRTQPSGSQIQVIIVEHV